MHAHRQAQIPHRALHGDFVMVCLPETSLYRADLFEERHAPGSDCSLDVMLTQNFL